MSTPTQYGHTLFLEGFQAGSSSRRLKRIRFLKNASESAPYDEAWLQHLIMRQPSLLPIDQIEPAFTALVPICVELPVGSGYLDNLLITPAGDLAIIECKLWRNPEARREVVAQILDYANTMSTWTYDTLQEAIRRAKPLDASDEKKVRSLYELVSSKGEIDEASFHDAVSRNLKRGRFLLLIVGDGIREGVESMAGFLQQYAGFHFTLAIVELALFEVPNGGYIAQPRILARTTNIDRGVVTLEEGRIAIKPPNIGPTTAAHSGRRMTITQERYFEQLEKHCQGLSEKLNGFIDSLAAHNASPEFGSDSMILRWRSDDTKSWNLGTITSSGQVWMDYLGQQARNAGLLELSKQYLTDLAGLVPGAYVKKTQKETAWNIAQNGKSITADALLADEARKDGCDLPPENSTSDN
ncbi:MAG TPA: hypothetical protein VN442_10465 [Bryobacteraceae bacterium]|nr:hypothetical protein [Bryobacteraceae bacterium]